MKIKEIIEKFKELKILAQQEDLILTQVSKENLAVVATSLVDEYKIPLALLFGTDDRKDKNSFGVHVVFSLDDEQKWLMISADISVDDMQYPALTKTIMAAHWYERYLRDMFGITPTGHPDLRRLVHHENIPLETYPLRKDFAWNTKLKKDNIIAMSCSKC